MKVKELINIFVSLGDTGTKVIIVDCHPYEFKHENDGYIICDIKTDYKIELVLTEPILNADVIAFASSEEDTIIIQIKYPF